MSTDADTLIRRGLARGLKIETILTAARAHQARQSSAPAAERPPTASDNTGAWLDEASEDTPAPAVARPVTSAGQSGPSPIEGLSRYDDLGLLGKGSMGEVRRVRDRRLGRRLALKILHARAMNRPSLVARFLEEAQATAQLQHPGIVPIYDLGTLPDGRMWFTMKEVAGRTFGQVIAEVHAASQSRWQPAASGWTLRRLVDALHQVCEAVGYAHNRGVVHRDLKPENIMVGSHGEVLVLDWGLAKLLGRPEWVSDEADVEPVQTDRSRDCAYQTQVGQVAGTPIYMSPEQAMGKVDEIDARSDVYALGALLYVVLSGRVPYSGASAGDVLKQVRNGPPTSLRLLYELDDTLKFGQVPHVDASSARSKALPLSLVAACERAMAREPAERFASAAELAAELQAWLEGSRRQDEARVVVDRATSKRPEAAALRARATALRSEASELLKGVQDWQPEEDKLPAWEKEDAATALERQAELLELEEESLLRGSLAHAPDLPEAHAALAARYRAEHEAVEAARQDPTRIETLLRQHVAALPQDHLHRIAHFAYLKGYGALTLATDPPGAEVLLYRYVPHRRRLVPRFERSLGTTPLRAAALPMGSYLCVLKHPERVEVRYPVSIGRGEHWHGVSPEGSSVRRIPLPKPGELGPDDCYVPPGWFACGGDPSQARSLSARRIWVDGQVFRRFPVTNTQYMAFLNDLVAQGRTTEALRHAPRERAGTAEQLGALIYGFDGTLFSLRPDAEGDLWVPEWPVMMVDLHGARAYAAWEAARNGEPWRLPGELAWEKAARGVDGRYHPWGDGFDPSWASMESSHRGALLPAAIDAFPIDESPYGIRGMAGNMCEWCSDVYAEEGPAPASARHAGLASHAVEAGPAPGDEVGIEGEGAYHVFRGGSWNSTAASLRASYRARVLPFLRGNYLGIRLARPYLQTSSA